MNVGNKGNYCLTFSQDTMFWLPTPHIISFQLFRIKSIGRSTHVCSLPKRPPQCMNDPSSDIITGRVYVSFTSPGCSTPCGKFQLLAIQCSLLKEWESSEPHPCVNHLPGEQQKSDRVRINILWIMICKPSLGPYKQTRGMYFHKVFMWSFWIIWNHVHNMVLWKKILPGEAWVVQPICGL